jgi:phosphoribosyl 1,2-cyclic phosphodiesterase
VHYAIIECNHDEEQIIDNAMDDVYSMSHYENHQSLDRCIEYLKAIYNPNLQGIILWHMSSSNIDSNKAKKKVEEALGFSNVHVALKGVEVELLKEEF